MVYKTIGTEAIHNYREQNVHGSHSVTFIWSNSKNWEGGVPIPFSTAFVYCDLVVILVLNYSRCDPCVFSLS